MRVSISSLLWLALFAACTRTSEPSPPSARFEIGVSALSLAGVTDVCYSLSVSNDANAPVWEKSGLCASQYGAGASITFVGACDATDSTSDGVATNRVKLTIDKVLSGSNELDDFIDPCPAPSGCLQNVTCLENQDTPVSFNLTLMRQANQGFFDIGVSFQDIFCSAKLDCTTSSGAPLNLLHNPATGTRGQTAVVALACTAGSGTDNTRLMRDDIVVTCGNKTTRLAPALTKGNAYGTGTGQIADPDPTDAIWQYAVYADSESLECGAETCAKKFWNVAIGFDPSVRNCRLRTVATAFDGATNSGFSTPGATTYPLIEYEVQLTTDTATPALACSRHPVNGVPTGVSTTYTGLLSPTPFPFAYDGVIFTSAAAGRVRFATEPPSSGTAGVAFSTAPVVELRDASNVLITTSSSVALSAASNATCSTPAPGTLIAATNPVTTSTGAASFPGLVYTGEGRIYLKATSDGLTLGCSSPIDITAVPPALTVTSPPGFPLQQGGATLPFAFSLTSNNTTATAEIKFDISTNGGTTWSPLTQVPTGAAPLSSAPYSLDVTLPSSDIAAAMIRLSFTDRAGKTATYTSPPFPIDQSAPTLGAGQMEVNGGATETLSSYVGVSLRATDSISNITHFCLKLGATAPLPSDACWTAVDASPPGLVPSTSLVLVNYPFTLGFTAQSYTIYAWVRDAAMRTSSLIGGTGVSGTDKTSVTRLVGAPPTLETLLAANSNAATEPISTSDLSAPAGSDVYIKWRLVSGTSPLGSGPVKIEYTTDDVNYVEIASGLANSAGSNCTLSGTSTGCYRWTAGAPTSNYFRIRVTAIDLSDLAVFLTSGAFNSNTTVLAGNTDPGTGGVATQSMFVNFLFSDTGHDTGSLVVNSRGVVYFRDKGRGVLVVDPEVGNQQLLIPTTGTSSGDGGPATSATLTWPLKLTLDNQDNLYIYDYDRIRRVDAITGQITLLIGGGATTTDGTLGTAFKITPPVTTQNVSPLTSFTALPNGDVYFNSAPVNSSWSTLKRYTASTGLVSTITFSGTGTNASPTTVIGAGGSVSSNFVPEFNNATSVVNRFFGAVTYYAAAFFGPNGVSTGSGPATTTRDDLLAVKAGLDGKLYASVRWTTSWYHIMRYDQTTNAWVRIVGNGTSGRCADGTAPLSCSISQQDFFVTASGQLYFMDTGLVRTIDPATGLVTTLYGAPYTAGDGNVAPLARFGRIDRLRTWNDGSQDRVTVLDWNQVRLREFPIGGNVSTLAGNGVSGGVNLTSAATSQTIPLAAPQSNFGVDPNGRIYMLTLANLGTGTRLAIVRLSRSTGRWEVVAGSLSGADPTVSTSLGLTGSALGFGYAYGAAPNIYQLFFLGGSSTDFVIGVNKFISMAELDRVLRFSYSDGTLLQRVGSETGGVQAPAFCADGTTLDGSCAVRSFYAHYGLPPDTVFDSPRDRYLIADGNTGVARKIRILSKGAGAVMGTLVNNLPRAISSFVLVDIASRQTLFYCGLNGTTYQLYRYDVSDGTEVALSLGLGGATCRGATMLHVPTRNSLVFPFEQNGLSGVMEYHL